MPDRQQPVVIALCGKGGVGKTSIAAMIVRLLAQNRDLRVLAVDADPAVGLATALGVTAAKTVDDIRNSLIHRVSSGKPAGKDALLAELEYELTAALSESGNIAFLAIGRPEAEGCYCQVNHLLKDLIMGMAENFDVVVIDGEAGVEQVNRRVMERVTHLLLVSDASVKGLNVASAIGRVAENVIHFERAGLIVNRLRNEGEFAGLRIPENLDCLGWVPEDDRIREIDMQGKSIFALNGGPAFGAVENCIGACLTPPGQAC